MPIGADHVPGDLVGLHLRPLAWASTPDSSLFLGRNCPVGVDRDLIDVGDGATSTEVLEDLAGRPSRPMGTRGVAKGVLQGVLGGVEGKISHKQLGAHFILLSACNFSLVHTVPDCRVSNHH